MDKGQRDVLQNVFPGGDRKPSEAWEAQGGWACGVQYPAHSFADVRDTKAIPHVRARLPPPSSILHSGF